MFLKCNHIEKFVFIGRRGRLNEYGCGKIYKEYIAHENGNKEWYSQALSKTMKFFKFLLKKNKRK